jgi:hypothetical protein
MFSGKGLAEIYLRQTPSIRRSALKAFDLLLTTDKNMRYQQNLTGRRIVIVVLGQQQWPQLRPHIQRVVEAV